MKFLAKINRNYLVLFIMVLVLSSAGSLIILNTVIRNAAEESLLEKKQILCKEILKSGEAPNLHPLIQVEILPKDTLASSSFNKIMLFSESENEMEAYLEYAEVTNIGGTWYSIKIRQAAFESEDLIFILALSLFVIISASLGISFFIAKRMNRTIWADFEKNLEIIEAFNIRNDTEIALVDSSIEEFSRLNHVLENLSRKLSTDYRSLKEFTENASHEIQTPLSIAMLHLDEMLQQTQNEENFRKTFETMNALKRLSNLNQGLILLAKIENDQFNTISDQSFTRILKDKISEFSSLFEARDLKLETDLSKDFNVMMDGSLAEILINNLLSNAVNHNDQGGRIIIHTTDDSLQISNTGPANSLSPSSVFDRFTKGSSSSSGLGLAIVKKICEYCQLEIQYTKSDFHTFTLGRKK